MMGTTTGGPLHAGHERVICSCGRLIRQCRCIMPNKPERTEVNGCPQCARRAAVEFAAGLAPTVINGTDQAGRESLEAAIAGEPEPIRYNSGPTSEMAGDNAPPMFGPGRMMQRQAPPSFGLTVSPDMHMTDLAIAAAIADPEGSVAKVLAALPAFLEATGGSLRKIAESLTVGSLALASIAQSLQGLQAEADPETAEIRAFLAKMRGKTVERGARIPEGMAEADPKPQEEPKADPWKGIPKKDRARFIGVPGYPQTVADDGISPPGPPPATPARSTGGD